MLPGLSTRPATELRFLLAAPLVAKPWLRTETGLVGLRDEAGAPFWGGGWGWDWEAEAEAGPAPVIADVSMHDNAGANWPGALLGMLCPLPHGQAEPASVGQWPKNDSGMELGGPVSR